MVYWMLFFLGLMVMSHYPAHQKVDQITVNLRFMIHDTGSPPEYDNVNDTGSSRESDNIDNEQRNESGNGDSYSKLLKDADTKLYIGCETFSKLSFSHIISLEVLT